MDEIQVYDNMIFFLFFLKINRSTEPIWFIWFGSFFEKE